MPDSASPERTSPSEFLPELGAFGFTLGLAWYFDWRAGDLVWGLWVSSLTVGYLILLAQILHLPMKGVRAILASDHSFEWRQVVAGVAVMSAFFGFILTFFSVHFASFHFGHGFILEEFFPIEGVSYPSGALEFPSFVTMLIAQYYGMVIASAVLQRQHILNAEGMNVTQPYLGVIKMHLMIFVFGGLHAAGAANFFFYAATLFAYFFPWRLLRSGGGAIGTQQRPPLQVP